MKRPIYLDHHATTPVLPEVVEAMLPFFTEHFGNAMSTNHPFGWKAQAAVENARVQLAQVINATPDEIVFTSGATESVHLALFGWLLEQEKKCHLITSPTEHKCVIEVCKRAETLGHRVTWLKVNHLGEINLKELENGLDPSLPNLISLMHGNNEIGTLHALKEIGDLSKRSGATFHVDAAQTFARHEIDVRLMNIDLLSFSSHKFYGPKGAGGLFIRQTSPRVRLTPYLLGGGQEKGIRGGTHNVPGIVGMGEAARVLLADLKSEHTRLTDLRDHMIKRLTSVAGISLNGPAKNRLCNNVSISISGVAPDAVLLALHNVAFSSSSACSSSSGEKSHVLEAIGAMHAEISSTIRFGLGRSTKLGEIDEVCERLETLAANARGNSRV